MVALTEAVQLWKGLQARRVANEERPDLDASLAEVSELTNRIVAQFKAQGITGLPRPDCNYCDPYGADLVPGELCPACGSRPEERF